MAGGSARDRTQPVRTTLVNASLLPVLQTLRTLKPRFQRLPRRGPSCPPFAGTGEPAKRNFSHTTLHPVEAKSSACFRSHAGNETTCSDRCAEPQPRKFPRGPRRRLPILHCATAGRLTSALVPAASTALCVCPRAALHVVWRARRSTVADVPAEYPVAEVLCPSQPVLPRSERLRGFARTLQPQFAFLL